MVRQHGSSPTTLEVTPLKGLPTSPLQSAPSSPPWLVINSEPAKDSEMENGANVPPPATAANSSIFNFTKFSSWARMVIFGQIIVLAVALTFFFLIQFTHTPMVQSLAEWGKSSPRSLAFCVTNVATLLSYISAFLFSKSLILFLTSHSNRPATLINFLSISSLSRGAPFISRHHINWAILSMLTLVILNSLTACFTTVLTPAPLVINVPIMGTEFSISTAKFSQAIRDPRIGNTFPRLTKAQLDLNNQVSAVIGPMALTSAYTSASRHLGHAGALSYLGTTFNSSTGGILPAIPFNKEAMAANPAFASSLHFEHVKNHFKFEKSSFKPSKKFPFNYTIIQEGFTADIKCQVLPEVSSSGEPGLSVEFVQNVTLPNQITSGFWRYSTQCPNETPTNNSILIRPRGSMLLNGTCANMDFNGNFVANSELLILGGFGPMYKFLTPRACHFTPYITLTEVQYSNTVDTSQVLSRQPITSVTEAVASLIYRAVASALIQYAPDVRNKVGDDIASLYGISARLDEKDDELLNGILENYFRGIIETRATLVKTPPISVGMGRLIALSPQDLSPEWTRTFKGTWSYETLGWHYNKDSNGTTILSMIPILAVTLTAILLSWFSLRSLKRTHYLSEKPFDPNDLVTLLQAGRDASVVEFLAENENTTGIAASKNVKIQLHRNFNQWQLRPLRSALDVNQTKSPSSTIISKEKPSRL